MRSLYTVLSGLILCIGCAASEEPTSTTDDPVVPMVIGRCTNAGDGLYCGSSRQNGFTGGTASVLYTCLGGDQVDARACKSTCTLEPAGVPDQCNPNPCAPTKGKSFGGKFCGASTQFGFDSASASPYAVYTCNNGNITATQWCGHRCVVAPVGVDDHC